METGSPICDFYNGAHILITGGTGFLGRLMVEKLLRSCDGIERIYLIARPKKNVDPTERFAKLFDGEVSLIKIIGSIRCIVLFCVFRSLNRVPMHV